MSHKVRGFCPICNAQRAFRIVSARPRFKSIWVIGIDAPEIIYIRTDYKGVCSRLHGVEDNEIEFQPLWFKHSNISTFKRQPQPAKFGRDHQAAKEYRQWREAFRQPRIEEHYQPGHECSRTCPMYDWPELEWAD